MSGMDLSELRRRSEAWGLALSEESMAGLDTYIELLLHFNRTSNLIGPLERPQIVRELLCDSVAAASRLPADAGRLLDVGSGAGLPGLPMVVARPGWSLTMVEPRKKRAMFLHIAIRRLNLRGVKVVQARIEAAESAGAERPFDAAVSKAFAPPPTWVRVASEWVRPGGSVLCLSRASVVEEIQEETEALGLRLKGALEVGVDDRAILRYTTPEVADGERA